jgi:hypothetical protein
MGSESELANELEAVAKRIEDRTSMVNFAWAFGLSCVAFMGVGVAIKLFYDSIRTPKVAYALAIIGTACAAVAMARLLRGLKLYRAELADFQRFQALRTQLGLDQPQLPPA